MKEHISKPGNVTSSVPQTSLLGTLPFLVFMIDIDWTLKFSILRSFADNTTKTTKRIKDYEVTEALRMILEQFYEWAERNNKEFFLRLMFELWATEMGMKSKPLHKFSVVSELSPCCSWPWKNHECAHIGTIVLTTQSTASSICRFFNTQSPELLLQL